MWGLAVLRGVAKNEELNVAEEFIEKQSAKMPGRPIFNKMLARIEKGEARGVPQIQWASIEEAHQKISENELSCILVGVKGIERRPSTLLGTH